MKKIIATVLAMVMALALCTTAFAAGFSGTSYENALAAAADGTTVTEVKKLTDNRTTSTAAAVTFYPATYLLTKTTTVNGIVTGTETETVVELATEAGATTFYVEGTTVRYFSNNTSLTSTLKLAKATVITDPDDAVCGSVIANKNNTVFYDAVEDEYYVAGGANGTLAYVNDMLVYVTAAQADEALVADAAAQDEGNVQIITHNFKAEKTTNSKGIVTYTKLFCKDCNKEFKFVDKATEAEAKLAGQTKFGVGKFSIAGDGDILDGRYFAYEKVGTTSTDTKTDGKDSPKTFDAGIAMYVGMALTSVAGSAVVIGKKKEF